MRLKDVGLGIKTSNPTHALDVSGSISMLSGSANQLLLPQSNDQATPTLAFGDGDTGFYESADDELRLSIGGTLKWLFNTTYLGSAGSLGGVLRQVGVSSTVPSIIPAGSDTNTGIG